MRYLLNAREKLAPQKGKWWTGGKAMKGSENYPFTFAAAESGTSMYVDC